MQCKLHVVRDGNDVRGAALAQSANDASGRGTAGRIGSWTLAQSMSPVRM